MSRAERFISKHKLDQPESVPATLSEVLEGKELTPAESRAFIAAEAIGVSDEDRRTLFVAYVFIVSGTPRAKELIGVTPDQAVGMRDRVRANDKYIPIWERFEILQRPYFAEVAIRRGQGMKRKEIAEDMGIKESQVKEILTHLITANIIDITPLGRGNAKKFAALVEAVEKADNVRDENGFRPTEDELAKRFGVSVYVIKQARERVRIKNREKPLSPKYTKKSNFEEVKARRAKVLEGLQRGLTNRQISEEYTIPMQAVRNDRMILRRKKLVDTVVSSIVPPIRAESYELENGSIKDYVLRNKGIESLDRLPLQIRTDFLLVDTIKIEDVSEEYFAGEIKKSGGKKTKEQVFKDLKIKLLGYRLWSHDPNFGFIEEYLPEGPLRLEEIGDIIDDKGELGRLNDLLADVYELSSKLVSEVELEGLSFIERFGIIANIIKKYLLRFQNADFIEELMPEILERYKLEVRETVLKNRKERSKKS